MAAVEAAVHAFFCAWNEHRAQYFAFGEHFFVNAGVYPKNEPLETKSETFRAEKGRSTI